jgi:hypothetical protein
MKPGKTAHYYWLESELAKRFSELNFEKGVDLNRDGRIEGSERTDLNDDGNIDVSELKQFLKANKPALKNLGGFLKIFYSHGQAFKPDNPLHNLLYVESQMVSPYLLEIAYLRVERILDLLKRRRLLEYASYRKLEEIYNIMKEMGIRFKEQDDILFADNMIDGVLDCDTSSFAALAVAHELDWPVYLVSIPRHRFVRWDDDKEKFNMEWKGSISDSEYIIGSSISRDAIDDKAYLKNLNPDEVLANHLVNRSLAKEQRGDLKGALADATESLTRNPKLLEAYAVRCQVKEELGILTDTIADCTEAIKIDPYYSWAYKKRGRVKRKIGDLEGAALDFTRAIRGNPSDALAYWDRAYTRKKLGDLEGAIADYTRAIVQDPDYVTAYNNRGAAKLLDGRFEESRADFLKARSMDPNYTWPLLNLIAISLIPDHLSLAVSPLIGSEEVNAHTTLGAIWPFIYFNENWKTGPQLKLGYNADLSRHLMDVSAGWAFMYKDESSMLAAEIGAGYNFSLAGDASEAPVRDGGIFQYGLRYNYRITDSLGIGASITLQHEMLDPERLAIIPGAELTYHLW